MRGVKRRDWMPDVLVHCYALASAYYEAVRIFGFQNVTPEQINDAARLLPDSARGKAPRL